jgi:DNA adenine methylase
MKPPISYYGGKQRMASKIVPLIPRHTVYCEPFCGGATILFAKPWPKVTNKDYYREGINDTDGRLINFYKQLRDNGDKLCEKILLTPFSEKEYAESLRENLECLSVDDLELARRYYVNIMHSFSNSLNGGWARRAFGRNGQATWAEKINELPQYIERMQSVAISCTDALKCIKQFDSPQTFFYCDPPYPKADQGHYHSYTLDRLRALVETLDNCQGSFILSNYDQPEIVFPRNWERFEFRSTVTSSGKGQVNADRSRKATASELGNRERTEIVWRRFNRAPVRPEIQKLYDSGAFDCFSFPFEDLL